MAVDYLAPGDSPDAAKMAALWTGASGFGTKLRTLLGGRSPIVAFEGVMPIDLLGKCFFWCHATQPAKYAYRVPQARLKSGTIVYDGGPSDAVLWSYDHAVFTNALAGATGHTYDELTGVVVIDSLAAGVYGSGLGKNGGVSLFDHSLQVHTHTRPSDGKLFYVQERSTPNAERPYRYAVADLILDGVTQVHIPDTWDKYLCFRVHNLNYGTATVTFGTEEVQVGKLGCKCVRRDRDSSGFTNYRVTDGYFFTFETGDFRHFWSDPLNASPIEKPATHERASNLANPAILYDWIAALSRRISTNARPGGAIPNTYAWFYVDPHEVYDLNSLYGPDAATPLLGSAGNVGTRIGDLIWHKGPMLIGKVHKTNKLPAPNQTLPDVELVDFTYNGLNTIVEDFAAVGIAVTTNGSGAYQFRLDAASQVDYSEFMLVPYGTNLFKDSQGNMRTAYRVTGTEGPTLDNNFFDFSVESSEGFAPMLSTTAPQVLAHRSFAGATNVKEWWDFSVTPAVRRTVLGEPFLTVTTRSPDGTTGTTTWPALQDVYVGDLVGLAPFRDLSIAPEIITGAVPATSYHGAQLVLTPFGHHLLFRESMSAAILGTPYAGGVDMQDFSNHPHEAYLFLQGRFKISGGLITRKRAIKFRGHGWPWMEREIFPPLAIAGARSTAMFTSPRKGRRAVDPPATPPAGPWFRRDRYSSLLIGGILDQESVGADGTTDYEAFYPGSRENGVKVLYQLKRGSMRQPPAGARFWLPSPQDCFNWFWEQKEKGDSNLKVKLSSYRNTLYAGGVPEAQPDFVYQLLSEHYNAMAMAVNQLTEGQGLDYRALRFVVLVPGQGFRSGAIRRNPAYTGRPDAPATGVYVPIPIDAWDYNAPGAGQGWDAFTAALYAQAGIPLRPINEAEMTGWNAAVASKNRDRIIDLKCTLTISGASLVEQQVFPFDKWWDVTGTVEAGYEVRYVDSQDPVGSAFNFMGWSGGIFSRRLTEVYANFQWVKQSEVMAFLNQFGLPSLPAGYDEVFVPLELRTIQAGTSESLGPLNVASSGGVQTRIFNPQAPSFAGDNPNGVYEATQVATHTQRYVKVTGFFPARTAALAQWKSPCFTRTVKNIKFWDSTQPCAFLSQVFAGLSPITRLASVTGSLVTDSPPGDNSFYAEGGPFVHVEFSPGEDEEPEEHELWLKIGYNLLMPMAVRVGSGSDSARPNVDYVFRPFWIPKQDSPFDTRQAAISSQTVNLTKTWAPFWSTTGRYPMSKYPGNTQFGFEWQFAGASTPRPAAPDLTTPGIHILDASNGTGRDRYHVHFGDREMGLVTF